MIPIINLPLPNFNTLNIILLIYFKCNHYLKIFLITTMIINRYFNIDLLAIYSQA